jgi:hypothetical protein
MRESFVRLEVGAYNCISDFFPPPCTKTIHLPWVVWIGRFVRYSTSQTPRTWGPPLYVWGAITKFTTDISAGGHARGGIPLPGINIFLKPNLQIQLLILIYNVHKSSSLDSDSASQPLPFQISVNSTRLSLRKIRSFFMQRPWFENLHSCWPLIFHVTRSVLSSTSQYSISQSSPSYGCQADCATWFNMPGMCRGLISLARQHRSTQG